MEVLLCISFSFYSTNKNNTITMHRRFQIIISYKIILHQPGVLSICFKKLIFETDYPKLPEILNYTTVLILKVKRCRQASPQNIFISAGAKNIEGIFLYPYYSYTFFRHSHSHPNNSYTVKRGSFEYLIGKGKRIMLMAWLDNITKYKI